MFDVPFVRSMSFLSLTAFMYGRDYQSYKKVILSHRGSKAAASSLLHLESKSN